MIKMRFEENYDVNGKLKNRVLSSETVQECGILIKLEEFYPEYFKVILEKRTGFFEFNIKLMIKSGGKIK